ncbi:MAG: ABC transporter ATP-binding protein [Bdellovibrionales bacterium]|nr:ABC transporter ATP-binding protein [Bdellovibrionales bacterium]
MNEIIFSAQNLTKKYGALAAVSDLSFDLLKGQVLGILGPNGSGKTTTLGMMLGVVRPTKGDLQWSLGESSASRSRRHIGALLEKPRFYPWMNAEESLKLTAMIRGVHRSEIAQALEMVGLWDRRKDLFKNYSLGMKQRLGLASAILGDPDVLVLDEPTNGIDAAGIADVRHLIIEQRKRGKTILLASHILDEVEKVCSHVLVLKQGTLLQQGSIEEVLKGQTWYELKARDEERLFEVLSQFPRHEKIEKKDSYLQFFVSKDVRGEDINQYCYDRGILLSEIKLCRRSLEEHFIEVLKK